MSILLTPLIPESAPFTAEQRAWLNGFLAGWLGLQGAPEAPIATAPPDVAPPESDEAPWHDPALPLDDRLELAADAPLEGRLMAAMAQLDCGSCGYVCRTYAEAIARGEEASLTLCTPGGSDTARSLKRLVKEAGGGPGISATPAAVGKPKAAAPAPGWSRANPYPARLLASRNLNGPGSEKRTHHVEIDLLDGGPAYEAGDALGVWPTNCPELVGDLLAALGADGAEPVARPDGGEEALREALARRTCLRTITPGLLAALAEAARDAGEAAALKALDEDDDALAGRDVLDLLRAYPSARLSPAALVAALTPMRPRLYSISSSSRRHPRQVHLTVGRVVDQLGGRSRKGVASTMLCDRLAPGDEVRVFVQASHGFRLPDDPQALTILIGPGTGIAPFRAFLQDRAESGATGRNWLFFGDRRRADDFLYEEELTEYLKTGVLARLDLAFSRDGDRKVYVQGRMTEAGAELFAWLEAGAFVYVCGDAKRMAPDVDRALLQIVHRHGAMDREEAVRYVAALRSAGRYRRDVY